MNCSPAAHSPADRKTLGHKQTNSPMVKHMCTDACGCMQHPEADQHSQVQGTNCACPASNTKASCVMVRSKKLQPPTAQPISSSRSNTRPRRSLNMSAGYTCTRTAGARSPDNIGWGCVHSTAQHSAADGVTKAVGKSLTLAISELNQGDGLS